MRWFLSKALYGVLSLSGMLMLPAAVSARAVAPFTVTSKTRPGRRLRERRVKQASGALLGRTDTSGRVTFECESPVPDPH